MNQREIEAFRIKVIQQSSGTNPIYWRDCDGLVFRVTGYHPAYAEGDDVPEPVAVLEGGKTASLLNSEVYEYYEMVPLRLQLADSTGVEQVVRQAIIYDDTVGSTTERVTDALLQHYDVRQNGRAVDRDSLLALVQASLTRDYSRTHKPSMRVVLGLEAQGVVLTPKPIER